MIREGEVIIERRVNPSLTGSVVGSALPFYETRSINFNNGDNHVIDSTEDALSPSELLSEYYASNRYPGLELENSQVEGVREDVGLLESLIGDGIDFLEAYAIAGAESGIPEEIEPTNSREQIIAGHINTQLVEKFLEDLGLGSVDDWIREEEKRKRN